MRRRFPFGDSVFVPPSPNVHRFEEADLLVLRERSDHISDSVIRDGEREWGRHWFLPVLPDDIYLYLSVPVRQGQSELRRPWLAAEDLRDELIEEEAIQCRLSPFLAEVHLSY